MSEVEGLPHDSGRGELAGPILALWALVRIQQDTGKKFKVRMKTDSMEIVRICSREGVKKLPSAACGRNADMLLQLAALKSRYKGEIVVSYVKAH